MKFIKPNRPVNKVYLHCSASDHAHHDNVATMRQWHIQRGWSDCGYHFFIRKDGTIELGRPLEKTPAAQGGHNTGSIAICLHGLKQNRFTSSQMKTLIALCHQIFAAYNGNITFHGHKEVAAKACPVFDYKNVLNLSPVGKLGIARPKDVEVSAPVIDDLVILEEPEVSPVFQGSSSPILRYGQKGWTVKNLQRELNALGYHVGKVDGHFGKRTRGAVLALQADNHLIEDGIVGAATWEIIESGAVREIADTRKSVGLVSMATGGSRIAQASVANTTAGSLMSVGGGLAVLEQTSGAVTKLSDSLGPWVGALVVLGGIYVVIQSIKAGRARVEDHRAGKTL